MKDEIRKLIVEWFHSKAGIKLMADPSLNSLVDEIEALCIPDVVGRSEQFKCVDTKHYTGITKGKTYKIFKNPNGFNYPHTRFIHVTNDLGVVKAYLKNCFEAF